jgi:hypothetical protein
LILSFYQNCKRYFFVLITAATAGAPKPHINDAFASKIALHDNFQLNCSASYDPGVTIDLKWFVPHRDGIDVSEN